MSYFNFHAIAMRLIKDNHLIGAVIYKKYKSIYPALVLYFDNHKPIPIREHKFIEYEKLIKEYTKIEIIEKKDIKIL